MNNLGAKVLKNVKQRWKILFPTFHREESLNRGSGATTHFLPSSPFVILLTLSLSRTHLMFQLPVISEETIFSLSLCFFFPLSLFTGSHIVF